MQNNIAIIGAGVAGIYLAKELNNLGFKVTIFEKSRGLGGRMSTRRTEFFNFDHGTQCFTLRTDFAENYFKEFIDSGILKEWLGKSITLEQNKKPEKRIWFEKHLVSCPTMNSLCKAMATNLDIKLQTEILELQKTQNQKWNLLTKDSLLYENYDFVISTAPPMQTYNLFKEKANFSEIIKNIKMHCCFALMIGFKHKPNHKWIAAKVRNSILKWISLDSSKPDRNNKNSCYVVHSKDEWANENKNLDINVVKKQMLEEFEKLTSISTSNADYIDIHRWLYALVSYTDKQNFFLDTNNKLAACGDWCITSRIEDAVISAEKLKQKLQDFLQ
jgi:predicted NAD/FAD-dependent oxidoreductase